MSYDEVVQEAQQRFGQINVDFRIKEYDDGIYVMDLSNLAIFKPEKINGNIFFKFVTYRSYPLKVPCGWF